MLRLFTSSLRSSDFILGFTLPMLPIAIGQVTNYFIFTVILGLQPTIQILLTSIVMILAALLFIAINLLCGSIFNDKQVGGVCDALLPNLSA